MTLIAECHNAGEPPGCSLQHSVVYVTILYCQTVFLLAPESHEAGLSVHRWALVAHHVGHRQTGTLAGGGGKQLGATNNLRQQGQGAWATQSGNEEGTHPLIYLVGCRA
jgi:hypothetical protein